MRPEPTRARLVRLAALATLSVPPAVGALLITSSPAQAAPAAFTITCPKSDGSAGGTTVSGTGQSCGTYPDSAQVVLTARCTPVSCLGSPTFVVSSPTRSRLFSQSLGVTHPDATYAVPAGSPEGTYTATLSGGRADVSATFVLQAASPASTAPEPTPTASSTGSPAPSSGRTNPTTGASKTGAAGSSMPSAPGAAPSSGSGPGPGTAAVVGRPGSFPSLPPPAGIAQLPPLPAFPVPKTGGEHGVPGPYGKTLPYDGSVTVAEKTVSQPTLLGHVANTFDDKQVAESVAAALLALLFAAHIRRFTRRPSGDADL